MINTWNTTNASEVYRHKLVDVPQILADWSEPFGGVRAREVLEFGCGEGTMALGLALQHAPARVVGVEVLDIYEKCLPFARKHLQLDELPDTLHLEQIDPGQSLTHLGRFDFVYSWSVFEHVSRNLLRTAMSSVAHVLKQDGVFLLQISPLYFSAFGSHLSPWIAEPWAHLLMPSDVYRKTFLEMPDASPQIMEAWSVYLDENDSPAESRTSIWNTYWTLNRTTALELESIAKEVGLRIVRDYRTRNEHPVPEYLEQIYCRDVLLTEQIVWLLQRESLA